MSQDLVEMIRHRGTGLRRDIDWYLLREQLDISVGKTPNQFTKTYDIFYSVYCIIRGLYFPYCIYPTERRHLSSPTSQENKADLANLLSAFTQDILI